MAGVPKLNKNTVVGGVALIGGVMLVCWGWKKVF